MPESRSDFKKKQIRSFFLAFEKKDNTEDIVDEAQEKLLQEGLAYKQMSLPVSDITEGFEEKMKEKVDHNILHAQIREATEEDLESVMILYNRSWLTSKTPFTPITLESLKTIHEYPETIILIAKVYGSDAGFVILDFDGKNHEYGIIAGLGVIPRFQRRGLGTVLGMAAWDIFKKKGVKELRCEVFVENDTSYNFIKALGFEEFETKVYKEEDFQISSLD